MSYCESFSSLIKPTLISASIETCKAEDRATTPTKHSWSVGFLGVTVDGKRDILVLWVGNGGEGEPSSGFRCSPR